MPIRYLYMLGADLCVACSPGTTHFNATLCAAAQWTDKTGALHRLRGQEECKDACAAYVGTKSYMGGIHPRVKKPVGERLAIAAMGVVYGATGDVSGPTVSGCSVSADSLTIRYNTTLLAGGAVGVKQYDGNTTFSAFTVLVDARYWCRETILAPTVNGRSGRWMCADPNAPSWSNCGNDVQCGDTKDIEHLVELSSPVDPAITGDTAGVWMPVDVKALSDTSVVLDLSSLNGASPVAMRYAWSNERDSCCESLGPTQECTPAACPIYNRGSGLPGNPFAARISGGKCVCIPPQTCDEGPATSGS